MHRMMLVTQRMCCEGDANGGHENRREIIVCPSRESGGLQRIEETRRSEKGKEW